MSYSSVITGNCWKIWKGIMFSNKFQRMHDDTTFIITALSFLRLDNITLPTELRKIIDEIVEYSRIFFLVTFNNQNLEVKYKKIYVGVHIL